MTTELSNITISSSQAAMYYDALAAAALVIQHRMTLQSAVPFKRALGLELAAYRAEMTRLSAAFPTVTADAAGAKK